MFPKKETETINDPESLSEIDSKVFTNNSNKEGDGARDHVSHETQEELEFLKSILRYNGDECARCMNI